MVDIKKEFEEHGYHILDDNVGGVKSYVNLEKDGYKYYIYYNAIYKTWNPKKWGNNNPYSMENISLYLKENNYKCELADINDKYDYDNIRLRCQCGNVYTVNMSNLLAKKQEQCPHCGSIQASTNRETHWKYDRYLQENHLKILGKYRGCKFSAYFRSSTTKYIYFGTLYNAYTSNLSCDDFFQQSLFGEKNKYFEYNLKEFMKKNNIEDEYVSIDRSSGREMVTFRCNKCNNEYTIYLYHFTERKRGGCPSCNYKRSDFDIDAFCKEYKLQRKGKFITVNDPIIFKNKDGYYIYNSVNRLKDENINNNYTIFHQCNPKVIDNIKIYIKKNKLPCVLLSTKYVDAKSKLKFQCKCGQIYKSRLYDLLYNNHICCENCRKASHSKLERITSTILNDLGIDFIREHTFEDCKYKNRLRFDFYLPNHNMCIECQGIQHFEPIDYFGGEEGFIQRKIKDKIKYDYCLDNNIKLKYILYNQNFEEIKEILSQIIT